MYREIKLGLIKSLVSIISGNHREMLRFPRIKVSLGFVCATEFRAGRKNRNEVKEK